MSDRETRFRMESPACWCQSCDIAANHGLRSRMSLCPECGDKRCPRAEHHGNECGENVKETLVADRELLGAAAKAAGYPVKHREGVNSGGEYAGFYRLIDGHWMPWDPLANDGDALRLAVKLRLLLDTMYNDGIGVGCASFDDVYENKMPDPYAATRRAIVRAAAAIGGRNV